MNAPLLNQRDMEFMLYELQQAEQLISRDRYVEHNRETFDAAIATAKTVAEKYFLPIRKKSDMNQPTFNGKVVDMIPEVKQAIDAVTQSGLASAGADFEMGGMQLPGVVVAVANAWLSAAGSTMLAYTTLSSANANLIDAYGTEEQKAKWVAPIRAGRYAGTMAMSEPNAGSSLSDLTTSAQLYKDGSYRIVGNKIWISGGDHELSENIVHLVLARVKGAPKGVKGISLFIVPKWLVDESGALTERNDVALAGLFHKMGGRGQTSTALNFGEQGGAVGYLVGEENRGLTYMFHMMNEARVMVGFSGAINALAGFQYSLAYAKERPQGRLPSCKDPESPPVNIIEHADVKRMLLAQKAYAEGGFALCLFGAQLADDVKTADNDASREKAGLLLDTLIPIIKTWPSEYGCKSNSLAIQVLGGAGYVNEHPVEMFYRDNRLNPIHEGTTGIQSLDLLGRKLPMNDMAGFHLLQENIEKTISQALSYDSLREYGVSLDAATERLHAVSLTLVSARQFQGVDRALSNATKYLEAFGNVVVAWIWLRQGIIATAALEKSKDEQERDFYHGKLQALKYFFHFELVEIYPWIDLLENMDDTSHSMQAEWF